MKLYTDTMQDFDQDKPFAISSLSMEEKQTRGLSYCGQIENDFWSDLSTI